MLCRRYGGAIDLIMQIDYEFGFELILQAKKETAEEMLYQRWLLGYEKVMSLDEFKNKVLKLSVQNPKKNETTDEILDKVKGILNRVDKNEFI